MIFHRNQPQEVGYAKEHEDYYRDTNLDLSLTHKDAKSIFSGLNQKDLFIFAMAVGKYHNQTKRPSDAKKNVVVSAMSEQQKWALLAIELSKSKDILNLNDERPFYTSAEGYAWAGMEIILNDMRKMGFEEYCENLEKELTEILGE